MTKINTYQDEERTIEISLKDSAGDDFDLTGWDIDIKIKNSSTIITKSIGSGVTVPTLTNGIANMELTAEDTAKDGPYVLEMRISDANSEVVVLKTTLNIYKKV